MRKLQQKQILPDTRKQSQSTFIFCLTWLLLSCLSIFVATPVQAQDRIPNLDKYCKQKYSPKINFPWDVRWGAKYDAKQRAWTCVLPEELGITSYHSTMVKKINLRDACRRMAKTLFFHIEGGMNPADPHSVRCGRGHDRDVYVNGREVHGTGVSVARFCNRTRSTQIWIALVYEDPSNGGSDDWTSVGWYNVERNQCYDYRLPFGYEGDIYVYAMDTQSSLQWNGNDGSFCVDTKKMFIIHNSASDECSDPSLSKPAMSRMTVRPGLNLWDFNQ